MSPQANETNTGKDIQWRIKGVKTAVSGQNMIAIPNPYQAGCGGGTHHGAPDGKLTCPLCRMRKESNWPKNMNSRSSNDPAVSARGSRLAWNSRRAPDPDMDVPAEDFLFVHTQPLFIIAI